MAKMDYNAKERVRLKADFLRLILGANVNPAKRSILVEFVETYMLLNQQETTEFQQLVTTTQDYQEVVKMITTYEQQGIEKGIEQGIERGERETLVRLVEKRFGPIEPSRKERILQEVDQETVKTLLLAVLDAESIEELGI